MLQKSSSIPQSDKNLQLAASAKWFHDNSRMDWLCANGLGIEYSPAPRDFADIQVRLFPYLQQKIPIRLHAFFPEYEIGDREFQLAANAMLFHMQFLEIAASVVPETTITCHIGLNKNKTLNTNRLEDNLGLLVLRARELGVTVAIENLREGPASDPYEVLRWAEIADSAITLDIGHIISSRMVAENSITVRETIDLFLPRLVEAHYYERESDRHYRPENMNTLGPVVDHLLRTPCRWWTIELEEQEDIQHTMDITLAYITKNRETESLPLVP